MRIFNSSDEKLDIIIDSLKEIKETREGVITLLEWKNNITEKIDKIERKKHHCIKEKELGELHSSTVSVNKWKWWILGIFFAVSSSLISFSINLNSEYTENKSNITSNKENITKIERSIENITNKLSKIQ